jgi:hypothetical protein
VGSLLTHDPIALVGAARERATHAISAPYALVMILQPRRGMRQKARFVVLGSAALISSLSACGARSLGDDTPTGDAGGSGNIGGTGGATTATGGTAGGGNVDGGPAIVVVTIDGGVPTMLAAGPAKTIALDTTHVYWTDSATNGIFKIAKQGGESIALVPERTETEGPLAVGPTRVCWARSTDGAILQVPIEGGTPVVVASQQFAPSGVAVDAANVYWTTYGNWFMSGTPKGTVMKASLETGVVTMIADNRTGAGAIAVDATAAYWSESGGGDTSGGTDAVMKVLLAGGSPVTLHQAFPNVDGIPYLIGIDGSSVYYRDGGLRKVPLSGGNVTTLLPAFPWMVDVRVDGAHVYWVGTGAIMRVSVAGGPQMAIATGDQPSALAVDETHLYWTNTQGAVMALAKP